MPRHPVSDHASSVKLAGRLWRDYLARYAPRLAFALIAIGVYAASASAIPIGLEWINSAFVGGESRFSASLRQVVVWGPVLIIALGTVNAGAQYLQGRLSLGAALSALRDIQQDMFRSLMKMDYAQLREDASGQIVSRFANDALVLRETLQRVAAAVRDVVTLFGLLAIMIYYDWALFIIVALVYPVIGWPVTKIGRYLRRASRDAQTQVGELSALVGETVQGARLVKTYALEDYEIARADAAFEKRKRILERMAFTKAASEPFTFFVGSIAIAIVLAAGAWRISAGALDGPQFVSFLAALLLLSQPARGLSSLNAVVNEGFGAFERMLTVIDRAPTVVERADAGALAVKQGEVEFRDVRFAYNADAPALDGLSFTAPAGATVALVGESGAGKSTVFHLLPRLYDVQSGAIEIDGQDIAGVTLASLRAAVAIVSQETILFNDTIRANIAFGRPGASDTEVEAAAKAAALDDFIAGLPERYHHMVGEQGGNLSGGQRQRIALARAFLKDAPILLLDEATSALDAESEAKIQEALARLTQGRTTLVIAHRLSTVREADLILVMDKGRVIETGRHDDLMAKSGAYARLAALQLKESVTA